MAVIRKIAGPSGNSVESRGGPEFSGLPEAGFRLLQQLKKNNDREWFRDRKSAYKETVEEPMEALVTAVSRKCRSHGLPLFPKEKNPVMRIYRDIRFSSDKTPFKTHVAAELRRSFGGSQPMLYLHFAPERSFAAAGVWQPDRTLLQAWRAAMVSKPDEIEDLAAALKRKRLEIEGEYSLSSMPRGFQNFTGTPTARYLKLTSFVVSRHIEREDCHTTRLVDKIVKFALEAKPLLDYGWNIEQTLPKNFPE
ncbi:MAG: DUF2461 domain-containing protein [Bryobacteraceae bacterium]